MRWCLSGLGLIHVDAISMLWYISYALKKNMLNKRTTKPMFKRTQYRLQFSFKKSHDCDAIMSPMSSQITSLTIVYSTVYSGANQRKHQSSAPHAFVREIHWWPFNSPHKGPATRKKFPFYDVIMHQVLNDENCKQVWHILPHEI